jgi:2'-5' RNA ligase
MRCFLAIELPRETRDRLAALQRRLSVLDRDVRWTKVDQIHLTVKFLGEVPDADVGQMCSSAATVARDYPPFDIQVSGTGCFPPRGPARIVWAGLASLPQPLIDCHKAFERAFAELGIPPETRPFHPHLTIGRVRDPRGSHKIRPVLEPESQFDGGHFIVEELVMFQSVLHPSGPTYTVLSHAALGG